LWTKTKTHFHHLNHMNLPIQISFVTGEKITYLYDASGKKLQKTVWEGSDYTPTDYLSGFQYIHETLDLFPTAEGYVKYIRPLRGRPEQFNYVFNHKDHLGNIRMSYAMDKEKGKIYIMEENHYYPFGLKHEKYNSDKYEYVQIDSGGQYPVGIEPISPQARKSSEYKYNGNGMEYDIYPRIIALAELNWTPKDKKNYKDFERRIDNQRVRLDMHNVNYYIPLPEQKGAPSCNFVAFTDQVTLEFKTTEPVKMVYTTDGSEPALMSQVYDKPLTFTANTTLKIRSVLLSDKMSDVRTITIEKQSYAPAVEKEKDAKPGLKAEYYKGYTRTVAELEGKTAAETEYVAAPQKSKHRIPNYTEPYADDYYSTVLTGYMNIPEDGVYYFSTDYELWIDGKLLISNEKDNNGTARRFSRSDKSVALAKGPHVFKLIRLGAIFGGWPTQWEDIYVGIRKADQSEFSYMDETYFK